MGFPHDRDSSFDLWDCSIGGFGYIDGGARKTTEGVLSVCRMVLNAGRHFRMRRLHDECSDASDED